MHSLTGLLGSDSVSVLSSKTRKVNFTMERHWLILSHSNAEIVHGLDKRGIKKAIFVQSEQLSFFPASP